MEKLACDILFENFTVKKDILVFVLSFCKKNSGSKSSNYMLKEQKLFDPKVVRNSKMI